MCHLETDLYLLVITGKALDRLKMSGTILSYLFLTKLQVRL